MVNKNRKSHLLCYLLLCSLLFIFLSATYQEKITNESPFDRKDINPSFLSIDRCDNCSKDNYFNCYHLGYEVALSLMEYLNRIDEKGYFASYDKYTDELFIEGTGDTIEKLFPIIKRKILQLKERNNRGYMFVLESKTDLKEKVKELKSVPEILGDTLSGAVSLFTKNDKSSEENVDKNSSLTQSFTAEIDGTVIPNNKNEKNNTNTKSKFQIDSQLNPVFNDINKNIRIDSIVEEEGGARVSGNIEGIQFTNRFISYGKYSLINLSEKQMSSKEINGLFAKGVPVVDGKKEHKIDTITEIGLIIYPTEKNLETQEYKVIEEYSDDLQKLLKNEEIK